jgi:hypothetical protein
MEMLGWEKERAHYRPTSLFHSQMQQRGRPFSLLPMLCIHPFHSAINSCLWPYGKRKGEGRIIDFYRQHCLVWFAVHSAFYYCRLHLLNCAKRQGEEKDERRVGKKAMCCLCTMYTICTYVMYMYV